MRDTRDIVGDDVDSHELLDAAHLAAGSLATATAAPV